MDSVGPFRIQRHLLEAPGAAFFAAASSQGDRALVQVVRLQAAASSADRLRREHLERHIRDASLAALTATHTPLLAFATKETKGSALLAWALPWPASMGPQPGLQPSTAVELLRVARALAQRLASRHALGLCEPLLSESTLIPDGKGGAEVLGAPVHVAAEWRAKDAAGARLAPEEILIDRPGAPGDLWRLGQALRALAHGLVDLPAPVSALIARLCAELAGDRPPRATDALAEIEHLLVGLDGIEPQTATVSLDALGLDAVNGLILSASGDSTRAEAARVFEPEDDGATIQAVCLLPSELPAPEPEISVVVRIVPGQPATRLFVHDRTPLPPPMELFEDQSGTAIFSGLGEDLPGFFSGGREAQPLQLSLRDRLLAHRRLLVVAGGAAAGLLLGTLLGIC